MSFWRLLAPVPEQAQMSHPTHIHLSGHWLWLSRVAWLSVAALGITISLLSSPIRFVQLEQVCTGVACDETFLRPQDLPVLQQWGLSPTFYAASATVLFLVIALVWIGLGTLLFWRKSADPHARFFAFFLMLFGSQYIGSPNALAVVHPTWWAPVAALGFLSDVCLILFCYLFPNGRFVPGWTRWPALAWILSRVLVDFFPGSPLSTWFLTGVVFIPFILGLYGSIIVAQVSRYRHHSTPVERQQTKWVVLAVVLVLVLSLAWVPVLTGETAHVLALFAFGSAFNLAVLLIPLAIALSILRYRLWEIDALVNKVLVYGLLTALLAAVYAGLVLGLQALLGGLLHQTNALELVFSTLVIYVLFQPLRRRIQTLIDRRFYRQKYDAASTLAAFSTILRTEVELGQLSEQVVSVVQETMHPTFVSLWLLKPQRQVLAQPGSPHETGRSE
jgi:hypothetical protein